MKQIIRRFLSNNPAGRNMYVTCAYWYYRIRLWFVPDLAMLRKNYKKKFGTYPNLENPSTFNEKLSWLKLNDRTPLHTQCADKYAVREHIAKKIGEEYLIPLVFHSKELKDVVPENFPDDMPFIIKTNHDSGGGVFVENKTDIDWKQARADLKLRLLDNYYYRSGEWQYKNIDTCILAEQLLIDENGEIPADFKLHCFNGKLGFVQVDIDRSTDHKRNIYDPEWNLLDCEYIYKKGRDIEKPKVLEKMKSLAEVIAKDFTFARVDFYNIGEKIYFGEITFHPESGTGRFIPQHWDQKFGDLLTLPKTK